MRITRFSAPMLAKTTNCNAVFRDGSESKPLTHILLEPAIHYSPRFFIQSNSTTSQWPLPFGDSRINVKAIWSGYLQDKRSSVKVSWGVGRMPASRFLAVCWAVYFLFSHSQTTRVYHSDYESRSTWLQRKYTRVWKCIIFLQVICMRRLKLSVKLSTLKACRQNLDVSHFGWNILDVFVRSCCQLFPPIKRNMHCIRSADAWTDFVGAELRIFSSSETQYCLLS